jgi:hypothetical protein
LRSRLARKKRVRTVASGMSSAAAVSSTLISSTARRTNTVRKASGSLSMRDSISLRTSPRRAWTSGAAAWLSSGMFSCMGTSVSSTDMGITSALRRERRSRPSDSLTAMRTSQVDSFASPRKEPIERWACSQDSWTESSASSSFLRIARAVRKAPGCGASS